jgi:protein ImuB
MLWLCLSLPQLAVELLQPAPDGFAAITDRRGARRILIACNEAARDQGVFNGIDATVALAREPRLRLIERAKSAELKAIKALAGWAEEFSSHVSFDTARWMLWLEIGASVRYFGGVNPLRTRIAAGIALLGYTANIGIAPTLEAAALLAANDRSITITTRALIPQIISALPLDTLAVGANVQAALQASGLHRIGEILDIPAAALSRRFGLDVTDYLQRLLGRAADIRAPYRAPHAYRRVFEFSQGVENVEGLLFALRRMLHEFQGFLRGRDTAIQTLLLSLRHRDAPDTRLTLHMSTPQRDAVRMFALLREKLERTALPQCVEQMVLAADQFVSLGFTQGDLFDDAPRRDSGWSDLLDKLRARLGEKAVRHLGLADDHRPEKAWCVQNSGEPAELPAAFPERPLWILDPKPLHRLPQLLGTPERIEAGWWNHEDSSRDYYIARTSEGARWWLYRDLATQQWFLQGLWA